MTLLELVVSMLIVGLMLSAGYGMLYQLERARRDSLQRREVLDIAVKRQRLAHWLSGVHIDGDDGVHPFVGGSGGTLIDATTASAAPVSDRPVRLLLFTTATAVAAGRDLAVSFSDPDNPSEEKGYVLFPGANATARYLARASDGTTWVREYVSTVEVPFGMEVTVEVDDVDSPHRILQLPILIATEQP
jgi:type II secretory pathway pseudopilin PulG